MILCLRFPLRSICGFSATARSSLWLPAALLFVAVLTPYIQTACFDFVFYDDDRYVSANPIVRQGLTWEGFRWAFMSGGYMATCIR